MESSASRPALPTAATFDIPEWVATLLDPSAAYASDEERMRLVVELSAVNVRRGTGGPFAAAVFERETGRVVAVGLNGVTRLGLSAAHAEVVALALAQRQVGSFSLSAPGLPAHELVASCAPCAMCLGAVLWSGVGRLVWGADREDALAIGFEEGPVFPESIRYLEERGIEVVSGLLRAEAREVLREYRRGGGPIYNG